MDNFMMLRDTTLGLNSFITAYNKTICQNEDVNTTDLDERFDDEYLINPQRVLPMMLIFVPS